MFAPQIKRKRVTDLAPGEPEGALVLSCPSWQTEQISMARII